MRVSSPHLRLKLETPCTSREALAHSAARDGNLFCAQCDKTVYDLRQATELEARAYRMLLGRSFCARMRVSHDGFSMFRADARIKPRGLAKVRHDAAILSLSAMVGGSVAGCGGASTELGTVNDANSTPVHATARSTAPVVDPARDSDLDRIPDADDACPNEVETFNGTRDEDGCPEMNVGAVVDPDGGIAIYDVVLFDRNRSHWNTSMRAIVDALGNTLLGNPDLRVAIRGYASEGERGAADLGRARAQSLFDEFVHRGVAAERLQVVNMGTARRSATSAVEENRAVDFQVLPDAE